MTLVRTVTPLPDENLAGLVARAAGINIYPKVHDVLSLANLGHIKAQALATKGFSNAANLAEVLGTTLEKIEPLFHRKLTVSGVDFFGAHLRSFYRETVRRRVSPLALRDKGYVRAIWSVRPISFDPLTKETLLDTCPVCKTPLGFVSSWYVEFCEHCLGADEYGLPGSVTDLRDFPQPLVEVDDVEALDFATALMDPGADRAAAIRLSGDLADLDRGELFELVVAIATALLINEDTVATAKPENSYRAGIKTLPPAKLAIAARAVMTFPAGLIALCNEAQQKAASRPGEWGYLKEFGALANLQRDNYLAPVAKAAIKDCMDRVLANSRPLDQVIRKTSRARSTGKYLGVRQLLELAPIGTKITTRLVNHPDMLTYRASNEPMSPVLFDTWQVSGVVSHYLDLVSESSLGVTLGLPPDAIRDFNGLIAEFRGGLRETAIDVVGGGQYYSKQSSDELIDAVSHGILFRKPPKGYIPFMEALLMFPAGRRPWMPLIEAIMYQRLDAVFHTNVLGQPKLRNLFGSISVQGIENVRDQILDELSKLERHDIGKVSAVAANLMLGIYNHHVFMACAREGLLEVDDDGADYGGILAFADRYIFSNEAAVRSRNSGQNVRKWLKARGVAPAYDFDLKGGLIFHRDQVEPHLELRT